MPSLFRLLSDESHLVTPCALLLISAALRVYAPYHHVSILRRLQSRELTDAAARRMIAFFRWSGHGLALLGAVLLLLAWRLET